jgi:hypothetical protein
VQQKHCTAETLHSKSIAQQKHRTAKTGVLIAQQAARALPVSCHDKTVSPQQPSTVCAMCQYAIYKMQTENA